ncbi:hypothetical protein ACFWY6_05135 [Streptomyces sp. NPDC059037]|uniref:hypothetical protein n=1 Tax=Streptomyces sp. NPDC059037 TaxID=3346710 RepID=UPI0036BC4230
MLGLQDTKARDHVIITHSEDDELPHARSLFAHLARHCVPPHTDKAPPLLTLVGWTAWCQHDAITDAGPPRGDHRTPGGRPGRHHHPMTTSAAPLHSRGPPPRPAAPPSGEEVGPLSLAWSSLHWRHPTVAGTGAGRGWMP